MKITKLDIIRALKIIKVNYSGSYNINNKEDMQLLIDSWYDILKDYDKEVFFSALNNAIKTSEYAPRIANIVEEIEKVEVANLPSGEEIWATLTAQMVDLRNLTEKFYKTETMASNGKSVSQNAIEKAIKMYDALAPELKVFLPSSSEFIALAREIDLSYIKGRFLKQHPIIRRNLKIRGGGV